jgi:hypothetical protein
MAASKPNENVAAAAPIEYKEGFEFSVLAFQNPPTSKEGMAETRSCLRWLSFVRAKELGIVPTEVPRRLMVIFPSWCHVRHYQPAHGKKVTMTSFRRLFL